MKNYVKLSIFCLIFLPFFIKSDLLFENGINYDAAVYDSRIKPFDNFRSKAKLLYYYLKNHHELTKDEQEEAEKLGKVLIKQGKNVLLFLAIATGLGALIWYKKKNHHASLAKNIDNQDLQGKSDSIQLSIGEEVITLCSKENININSAEDALNFIYQASGKKELFVCVNKSLAPSKKLLLSDDELFINLAILFGHQMVFAHSEPVFITLAAPEASDSERKNQSVFSIKVELVDQTINVTPLKENAYSLVPKPLAHTLKMLNGTKIPVKYDSVDLVSNPGGILSALKSFAQTLNAQEKEKLLLFFEVFKKTDLGSKLPDDLINEILQYL